MAFDGIVTEAAAREISEAICLGKVDRINQPSRRSWS